MENEEIKKELKAYAKAIYINDDFQLKQLRPYNHKIGAEWFANIRMDIESLEDPQARPR